MPKAELRKWQEKALSAAKGDDLYSLMELFVQTRAMEPLADLVSNSTDEALEQVSHYASGTAAQKLEKAHPDLAARLWRAQGMRIADAKKSKLGHFSIDGLSGSWARSQCTSARVVLPNGAVFRFRPEASRRRFESYGLQTVEELHRHVNGLVLIVRPTKEGHGRRTKTDAISRELRGQP